MQEALINGELMLTYPKGFHLMEPDELKQAFMIDYPDMWGIHDKKRHMIISLIWKEASGVVQKLVSVKSQVKEYEKRMRKSLRSYDYQSYEFFDDEIAGQVARGFRFYFKNEGVGQVGEMIVFKHEKCNYSLYYYTRPETQQDNRSVYKDILASFAFSANRASE